MGWDVTTVADPASTLDLGSTEQHVGIAVSVSRSVYEYRNLNTSLREHRPDTKASEGAALVFRLPNRDRRSPSRNQPNRCRDVVDLDPHRNSLGQSDP